MPDYEIASQRRNNKESHMAGLDRIRLSVAILGLSIAATASGQVDTAASTAKSAPPAPKWFDDIAVNAFVSTSYQYNTNRPDAGTNSYRVFDFSHNTFNVDVAELVVQMAPSKPNDAGFRLDFVLGSSIPKVAKSQDENVTQFDLQQAFVSYIVPLGTGLRFDAGKYVTHLGYEVIDGYDGYDDNYSRSVLFGYAIPFTHTGLKASYAFSSKVAAMVGVVNGWDLVHDNNRSKSLAAQVTLTPVSALSVLLNWIGGPEIADDNHTKRNVFDVVAILKPTNTLTLGLNGDYGVENGTSLVNSGSDAVWKGIAGYATLALSEKLSVALRGETFHDDDGVRLGTGTKGTLSEGTLTTAYKFTPRVVLRGEVRFDKANQAILARRGTFDDKQTTVGANFIFVY